MLDAHHDDPSIGVPTDLWTSIIDDVQNNLLDLLTIGGDLPDGGPVIVGIVEVIPVHLIDADCEDGLKVGVDSVRDESFVEELVDVHASCVAIVENQRMAQGFWLGVVRFLMLDEGEELFVPGIRVQKILLNLIPGAPVLECLGAEMGFHAKLLSFRS